MKGSQLLEDTEETSRQRNGECKGPEAATDLVIWTDRKDLAPAEGGLFEVKRIGKWGLIGMGSYRLW